MNKKKRDQEALAGAIVIIAIAGLLAMSVLWEPKLSRPAHVHQYRLEVLRVCECGRIEHGEE